MSDNISSRIQRTYHRLAHASALEISFWLGLIDQEAEVDNLIQRIDDMWPQIENCFNWATTCVDTDTVAADFCKLMCTDGKVFLEQRIYEYVTRSKWYAHGIKASQSLSCYLDELEITIHYIQNLFAANDFDNAFSVSQNVLAELDKLMDESEAIIRLKRSKSRLLRVLGSYYSKIGERSKSRSLRQEAFQIAKEIDDLDEILSSLNGLGMLSHKMTEKLSYFSQAYHLAKKQGSAIKVGETASNLGHAYSYIGEFEKAEPLIEEALSIADRFHLHTARAIRLAALGTIRNSFGEHERALQLYHEALQLDLHAGRTGLLRTLHLVRTYTLLGEYEDAHKWLEKAKTIPESQISIMRRYSLANDNAELLIAQKRYKEAEEILLNTKYFDNKVDNLNEDRNKLKHLCLLAQIYLQTHRFSESLSSVSDISHFTSFRDYHIRAKTIYSIALAKLGEIDSAITSFDHVFIICSEMLDKSKNYYSPKYFRATALAALSILGKANRKKLYYDTLYAFNFALSNSKGKGIIEETIGFLQMLQDLDIDGYLDDYKLFLHNGINE